MAWGRSHLYCGLGLRKQLEIIQKIHAPTNTDDEVYLRLSWDVEVTSSTGSPPEADFLTLRGEVLLHVLLGTLEDDLSLSL